MLVLVRHGESTLNAEGVLVGRLDPELTERGRSQAVSAGGLLGPTHEVRTTSLRRARQTATLIGCEAPVVVDDRFIELDYGVHDGTPLSAVPAALWDRWISDASFAPDGGESLEDLSVRIAEAMDELFAEADRGARREGSDVVVVSHVSPIKAAVAWALQADPLIAWRTRLSNASVTRIAMGPRGPLLLTFNETAGP